MNNAFRQRNLRKTAIEWFLLMRGADAEHPDRSRFEAWLMSSTSHQQAYDEVRALWESLDSPDDLQDLEDAMRQKVFIEKSNRRKKIRTAVTGTLGLLLFAALGAVTYRGYEAWQNVPTMQMAAITEIGQVRSQTLDDGTRLKINSSSDVEISYSRNKRHVTLKRGEASFEVAPNPDRPFVVDSGIARVTVLGTHFAVNKFSSKVRVSVDHGTVRVEHAPQDGSEQTAQNRSGENVLTLRDNDVAEISADGKARLVQRPASDAFSFETGEITFDNAGLEEIAETLSRYRAAPVRFQLLRAENDIAITALLKVRDLERFIGELPLIADVKVEHDGAEVVLLPAQERWQK